LRWLWRQVERFDYARERYLCSFVNLANVVDTVRFKQAHAMGFSGNEGGANVANRFTFVGKLLAGFKRAIAGGAGKDYSELMYLMPGSSFVDDSNFNP
jgi:hypothetical protein